jgi:hypothetical protein
MDSLTVTETQDGTDQVSHTPHDISNAHIEAARRLLHQMKPSMTCTYKDVQQLGEYPLGTVSTIARLAFLDRGRFDAFVANCRMGVNASLVTKIEDLATFEELGNVLSTDAFCPGVASAFLNPCDEDGFVQMSAQFSPVHIALDNKTIRFHLACSDKHRDVCLLSADIYHAFETRCRTSKRYAATIRKLIDTTVSANIELRSTFLAGHKIWIHMGGGELATIYVVQHKVRHRNTMSSRLAIVAADLKVRMLNDNDMQDSSNECVICFESLCDDCWKCARCRNRLHVTCAKQWKDNAGTCPFCRKAM